MTRKERGEEEKQNENIMTSESIMKEETPPCPLCVRVHDHVIAQLECVYSYLRGVRRALRSTAIKQERRRNLLGLFICLK